VNAVSCTFAPGTLTAIVGPNGAGKTTYFNLISGQLKATAGRVGLNGQDLTDLSASARTRAGLGRAFQLTNLFPNLSVLENVRLAVQATLDGPHRRGLNLWSIWSDHTALTARACHSGIGGHGPAAGCAGFQPAARRPAQAGSGTADGPEPAGVHV
jgi:branched-chain amino acid transport system ATP-binding protein